MDKHVLQHCAGAIGTRPNAVILQLTIIMIMAIVVRLITVINALSSS